MLVYLIGGPPKCGKTTLAKKISKETGNFQISTDSIQGIARSYIPECSHKSSFPHYFLKGETNDETYSLNSIDTIVDAYIKQGKTCLKAIKNLIEFQFADEQSCIIEGYHITPSFVNLIISMFGKDKVRACFLIKQDAEIFVDTIRKSLTPNDRVLTNTQKEETYYKIGNMVSTYSDFFLNDCDKYGFDIFAMDFNFEGQMELAMNHLLK